MKWNQYYDINNFNMNYTNDNKLSFYLLNIRSLPDHFREMVTYLDCLNIKLKIIALTETWLKDHHTNRVIAPTSQLSERPVCADILEI